jgi:hypothetical protein
MHKTRDQTAVLSTGAITVPSGEAPSARPILEGYLTEDQLAAEIGRSPRTIARWRALGEGPPVTRIGRQILYRESSAKAWLESLEQEAD